MRDLVSYIVCCQLLAQVCCVPGVFGVTKHKKEHMVCFDKLLSFLTELRSLGSSSAKTCFELRMINRKLPPFLGEIWEIKLGLAS